MFENPKHYEQEWDYVCESIANNPGGANIWKDEVKKANRCIVSREYWRTVDKYGVRSIIESLLR